MLYVCMCSMQMYACMWLYLLIGRGIVCTRVSAAGLCCEFCFLTVFRFLLEVPNCASSVLLLLGLCWRCYMLTGCKSLCICLCVGEYVQNCTFACMWKTCVYDYDFIYALYSWLSILEEGSLFCCSSKIRCGFYLWVRRTEAEIGDLIEAQFTVDIKLLCLWLDSLRWLDWLAFNVTHLELSLHKNQYKIQPTTFTMIVSWVNCGF